MLRFVLVVFLMMFIVTGQVFAHGAKDPTAALLLALIIPGGGQIYNEQYPKALIPIGSIIVGSAMYGSADSGSNGDLQRAASFVIAGGAWIWSIFDAPMTADKINQQSRFGHLMEFDGDRITVGVDPIASRRRLGTTLSLRF